jgi:hypothetical protein
LAALTYHDGFLTFPPGVDQRRYPSNRPPIRGYSLFVFLLPYLEQEGLNKQFDFSDPLNNTVGGQKSLTAMVPPRLVCQSDLIPENPTQNEPMPRWYGLTSYGGTRSYNRWRRRRRSAQKPARRPFPPLGPRPASSSPARPPQRPRAAKSISWESVQAIRNS